MNLRESDAIGSQPREPQSVAAVGGVVSGVRLLFEGVGMLLRERRLWALAAVPMTLCTLALAGTSLIIYANAAALFLALTSWLPGLEVAAWYEWLWLGPAKLLFWLFEGLLFAAFCGVSLLVALLVANLVSAPFLDLLSQRVELIVQGKVSDLGESGLSAIIREGRKALTNELQRLVFFVAVWGVISLGGVLIPGGQLIAPPLLLVFTALFLPLDYASYHLDRRQIPFLMRRRWLRDHLPVMLGFGSTAMATALVPGLNLLLLPSLVIAGTLLALRLPVEA
ncbi:MAG: EI24 domain-containing protein [Deltaproteobacteria bacterium]|nr:EI24 domain-containing protein [Deltaproteobacteria bacterium]